MLLILWFREILEGLDCQQNKKLNVKINNYLSNFTVWFIQTDYKCNCFSLFSVTGVYVYLRIFVWNIYLERKRMWSVWKFKLLVVNDIFRSYHTHHGRNLRKSLLSSTYISSEYYLTLLSSRIKDLLSTVSTIQSMLCSRQQGRCQYLWSNQIYLRLFKSRYTCSDMTKNNGSKLS